MRAVYTFGVALLLLLPGCSNGDSPATPTTVEPITGTTTSPKEQDSELAGGERRVYPAGRLSPGETLACVSAGLRVTATVPSPGRVTVRHADGVQVSVELTVRTRTDQRVVANCR